MIHSSEMTFESSLCHVAKLTLSMIGKWASHREFSGALGRAVTFPREDAPLRRVLFSKLSNVLPLSVKT